MKILHVCKTFFPDTYGGVEHFVRSLSFYTSKLGVKNTVLTASPNPEQESFSNIFDVVRCKTTFEFASCPVSISMLKKFEEYASQADLIQIHFPWPYADFVTLIRRHNKKFIVTYHSDIIKQKIMKLFYQPLKNHFLGAASKILVSSPNLLNTSQDLSAFRSKCSVIPLAIDFQLYPQPNTEKVESWRTKVGSDFLLFIGQFRYYKGVNVLLDALKGISVPVVLLGSGSAEEGLKSFAKNNSLKNVNFVGSLPDEDKVALLKLCRAVVLPSIVRSEAFGLSLLEGLAYGKPLISTDLGTGTSYVNLHNVTGFVVPPNDPIRLQEAILKLFADKEGADKMGLAAYQYYQENFMIDKIAQQYVDCYQQVLND